MYVNTHLLDANCRDSRVREAAEAEEVGSRLIGLAVEPLFSSQGIHCFFCVAEDKQAPSRATHSGYSPVSSR